MNYPAASGRGIRYFIKSENLIGFPTPFPFKETPPQGTGVLKIKIKGIKPQGKPYALNPLNPPLQGGQY